MKVTFTCRGKNLNLSIDPGRPMPAKYGRGETTVFNVATIKFRNHTLETEDPWEINEVKEWIKKHPEDGIKIARVEA